MTTTGKDAKKGRPSVVTTNLCSLLSCLVGKILFNNLFVKYKTPVLSSAAVERFFS
jgi:hypothetical protein